MSEVQGVTAIDGTNESSSQNWFYNPEYSEGVNKSTSSFMDEVNQTSQDEQNGENQIAEIWGDPTYGSVKSF